MQEPQSLVEWAGHKSTLKAFIPVIHEYVWEMKKGTKL